MAVYVPLRHLPAGPEGGGGGGGDGGGREGGKKKRREYCQSPVAVLKVPLPLRCALVLVLAPCLARAAGLPWGSPHAPLATALAQDLMRTKLALTPTTVTTVTTTTTASTTTPTTAADSPNTIAATTRTAVGPVPASSVNMSDLKDHVERRLKGRTDDDVILVTTAAPVVRRDDVTDDEDLTLSSGSGSDSQDLPETASRRYPHLFPRHGFKDSKRKGTRHVSCCFVGKMAASQNLHCHAQYHVDKLRMREEATAAEVTQDRRGSGAPMRSSHYGRLPANWSRDKNWCVRKKPLLFQKCCYGYASSRTDRHRWFNHRKTRTGSSYKGYLSWRYIYS